MYFVITWETFYRGCVEPPVTPVGRDELELKRQRIYKDLILAAQAAVNHSARFEPFIFGTTVTQSTIPPIQYHSGGGEYIY